MTKSKAIAFHSLVGIWVLSCVAFAAPSLQKRQVDKAQIAQLTDAAFGAVWIDNELEDADRDATVRAALRAGVTPNMRDQYGDTLLLQAIENDCPSVVRILLRARANVNMPNLKTGETPLMRAISSSTMWTVNAGNVQAAYKKAQMKTVELLLQERVNLNQRDKEGNTALIVAVSSGYSDIVVLLIKAGANFNLRNKSGHTPLQIASTPIQRGSIQFGGGGFPTVNSNDPKEIEKALRREQESNERMERAEEQRMTKEYAKIRRLLRAAGAKE